LPHWNLNPARLPIPPYPPYFNTRDNSVDNQYHALILILPHIHPEQQRTTKPYKSKILSFS